MIGGQGSSSVSAAAPTKKDPDAKVTICHRTSSVTNPYVRITVAQSSIGNAGSKHGGAKHDTYATTLYISKPVPNVFDPTKTYPSNDKNWGDIIPNVDVDGNQFDGAGINGLNYSGIGIQIYNGTGIYAGLCGNFNKDTFCADQSAAGVTGQDLQDSIDELEKPEFTSCPASVTTTSPGVTTTSPGVTATRKLKGKIWIDTNRDGKKDSNERILRSYSVTVTPGPGNAATQTFTVVTDESGNYEIADLPAGNWIVRPAALPSADYENVFDTDSNLVNPDWIVAASVPSEGEATADFSLALTVSAVESGVVETIGAVAPVVDVGTLPKTGSNSVKTLLFVTSLMLLGWFFVRLARRQDLGING